MNIEQHLVRLLHAHDCVIVPGFGGFIGDAVHSEIDGGRHLAFPPSKKIAFNTALRKNDGLLASYIASAEKIEYADAFRDIQRYVADSLATLESRKHLVIESLGALHMDGGRHIHFLPEEGRHFRYDSFGLAPLQLVPIAGRHEAPPATRHALPKPVIRTLQWLPVAALLVFVAMLPSLAPRIDRTLAGIFPMYHLAVDGGPATPAHPNAEPLPVAEKTPDPVPAGRERSSPPALAVPTGYGEEAALSPTEAPAVALHEAAPVAAGAYHIVVGCFGVKENAVAFTAQLQDRGYAASDLGLNKAGLTMVSASSYATLDDAAAALPAVRSAVIGTAWILHKP